MAYCCYLTDESCASTGGYQPPVAGMRLASVINGAIFRNTLNLSPCMEKGMDTSSWLPDLSQVPTYEVDWLLDPPP